MKVIFTYKGNNYSSKLTGGVDLTIPMQMGTENPNCYYAEAPQAEVIRFGESFVGSVAKGGSCNYLRLQLTPHGNGTHTESYGHISEDIFPVADCLNKAFYTAVVISIEPEVMGNDQVLRTEALAKALGEHRPEAIIIRTLPNELMQKEKAQYSGTNPPYPEPGMGLWLRERGVQHWLLDLPSVDREEDGGKLKNHHDFWNFPEAPRENATITELIAVPNTLEDGLYLLQLTVPRILVDAVPSRVVLFPTKTES